MENPQEVITECLSKFCTPDYIMEPGIFTQLKRLVAHSVTLHLVRNWFKRMSFHFVCRYFQAGGTPEQVINQLSTNYTAVAQMANLLAEWLILAGVCVTDVQAMVENHLKDMILRTFDPKKADTIFTEEGEVSILAQPSHFWSQTVMCVIVPDASLVDGDDWPSHVAFSNLSTGRRISRLFDVEFHHQIDIGRWIPKWNYVDINRRTANWSIFACIENIDYEILDKSGRQTEMYWRVCGMCVGISFH